MVRVWCGVVELLARRTPNCAGERLVMMKLDVRVRLSAPMRWPIKRLPKYFHDVSLEEHLEYFGGGKKTKQHLCS